MSQQVLDHPKPVAPQSRWTLLIRVLAVGLGVVVLVFGTGSVIGFFLIRTDVDTRSFSSPVKRVKVTATDGNVVIRTGLTQVGATVVSRNHSSFRTAEHRETITGDLLEVNGSCRGGFFIADQCSVDLEITVGPGTAVTASTSTGNISIRSTRGPVTAESNTGDLRVSQATGPVSLTTDVGDVTGELLDSTQVRSRSTTGDVRLSFVTAPERVQAFTEVGDVRISVPDDAKTYRVICQVDLGDRHINVPTDPDSTRRVEMRTSTGDVRIGLLSR